MGTSRARVRSTDSLEQPRQGSSASRARARSGAHSCACGPTNERPLLRLGVRVRSHLQTVVCTTSPAAAAGASISPKSLMAAARSKVEDAGRARAVSAMNGAHRQDMSHVIMPPRTLGGSGPSSPQCSLPQSGDEQGGASPRPGGGGGGGGRGVPKSSPPPPPPPSPHPSASAAPPASASQYRSRGAAAAVRAARTSSSRCRSTSRP